jgi:hypothetical protein
VSLYKLPHSSAYVSHPFLCTAPYETMSSQIVAWAPGSHSFHIEHYIAHAIASARKAVQKE